MKNITQKPKTTKFYISPKQVQNLLKINTIHFIDSTFRESLSQDFEIKLKNEKTVRTKENKTTPA
jgi:hypothetical protein